MRQSKIVIIGDAGSQHISSVAFELLKRGHRVVVVSGDRYRARPEIEGVIYHYIKSDASWLRKALEVRRAVAHFAPDIVHSHYLTYGGVLALLAGRHPHVASVWGDDIWLDPGRSLLNRCLVRSVLRNADLLLPVSEHLRRRCLETSPDCARAQVFQWGVDTALFRFDEKARDAFRRRLGVGDDETLIFSPRALQPSYNHHLLLEAFGRFKPRGAKLLLKRFSVTPGYEEALAQRAQELGIAAQVLWIESLPPAEMSEAFSAADLVVSLSVSDGAPVTVQEAMACSRVVLAADTEGSRDWIKAGRTGFLTALTVEAVTECLGQAFALHSGAKTTYEGNARAYIMDHADRKRCFDRLESIYEGLLH